MTTIVDTTEIEAEAAAAFARVYPGGRWWGPLSVDGGRAYRKAREAFIERAAGRTAYMHAASYTHAQREAIREAAKFGEGWRRFRDAGRLDDYWA